MSQRQPKTHELKCHPGPFAALLNGTKPFEWRKDDRDYQVGDTLRLMEWDPGLRPSSPDAKEEHGVECELIGYTGHVLYRTVTYIIREGYGIPQGYCIMGLAAPHQGKVLTDEEVERIAREWRIVTRPTYGTSREHPLPVSDQQVVVDVLKYIRDHGYLAPSTGLTVDQAMECVPDTLSVSAYQDIRSRLEARLHPPRGITSPEEL